ncbi:MAG: VOC family protein [Bacteroidetes bacterium]|nr:VOC family protein [Bacteroidota bacterium]MCW5894092.1 VOC family protein [Bacteroidota bacterium]
MHTIKLGNYAHISISVTDLQESSRFYELLGFKILYGNNEPHPWALFTDGSVNIHLYQFSFVSPALHYFSNHMQDKVLELMRLGIRPGQQTSKDGHRVQSTIADPSEFLIMLMHHNDAEMPKPDGDLRCRLGTFGELSINTENLGSSVDFWEQFDFTLLNRGEKPYPWAIMADGVMTVGFHQTSSFTTPALTYYATDVYERVQLLKYDSFRNLRELKDASGTTEGAILQAPEGQLLFVLKGRV